MRGTIIKKHNVYCVVAPGDGGDKLALYKYSLSACLPAEASKKWRPKRGIGADGPQTRPDHIIAHLCYFGKSNKTSQEVDR
jgi:hypothetical protein